MAHLKRLVSPTTWKIERKKNVWIVKPKPGAHALKYALPLKIILRDILRYASNTREVKKILSGRGILINGRVETLPKAQVGVMDILEISNTKECFRIMLDRRGKLSLEKVQPPKFRLCRIEGKTILPKGKIQLNLFGGVNIIVPKHEHRIYDVLKLSMGENKLIGKIELKNGASAFIIGGNHIGVYAKIKDILKDRGEALLESGGTEFRTKISNLYVVE